MRRTLSTLVVALFGAAALAKDCTGGKAPVNVAACFVGGCSSHLCTEDRDIISTCEWRDEYICYSDATCERQKNGKCGWTQTKDLKECLKNPPQPSEPEPNPNQCHIGGCSGQVCSEDADVITTCEWRDEYICYESTVCERQRDGECGWTSTRDFEDCLANPPQPSEPEPLPGADYCYITGCSGQVCSNEPAGMVTTCEWRDEYLCYQAATCERQRDGDCGWTNTAELRDCLENPPSEAPQPEPTNQCFVGGCSSQLCTDDPNMMSTCEWTDSYACYADATCERQRDGECGWTSTAELRECLENPPSTSNAV